MLEEYKNYFKDNPEGLWFKRKLYGWGWTPVKWQGWLVIVVYVAALIYIFHDLDSVLQLGSDIFIGKVLPAVFLTIILFFICYKKGEAPKWSWGLKKKE